MADHPLRYNPEEEHFNELFDTYLDRVYDYIHAITKSHYIAEEASQELFIILWKKRNELSHVDNIDHYIFRIARNLAFNQLKKAALDSRKANEFYQRSVKESNPVAEQVNRRTLLELVDKAVAALPPQPRKIYMLSRKEQLNFDEIATRLDLSRNTVKNHLNKALNDIRAFLIENGYQPVIIALILKECFWTKPIISTLLISIWQLWDQ